MSAFQSESSGQPGLTLNLASNNPFRNRTASPNSFSPPAPLSPFDDPPARPTSSNPFLDPSISAPARRGSSPDKMASPPKKPASPTAEEIFDALTLDESKPSRLPNRPPPPPGARPPNRPPGTGPARRGPPPSHRPTRSQEEALKARRMQATKDGDKKPSDSPQKRPERRPRRNSESSVIGTETEEEKKARELKRREREKRYREGKEKRPKRIDIIDQLDATSVYGSGLFHHDGPFDACNPHRNRKGSRRAPMHAFAKDSANNSLGGSGPLNRRPDHKTFMGHNDPEAFKDYAKGANENGGYQMPIKRENDHAFFDPKAREDTLHGDESMGLGTSTFLEGAPAARSAIQRRQAEMPEMPEGGLQRKKSLAQRIRGINRGPTTRIPDSSYSPRMADASAGSNGNGEANPFFNEFDKSGSEDVITVKRTDSNPRSPASPPAATSAPLERRATTDATAALSTSPEGGSKPQGNGFLSRVKSLKGGRRQRPDMNNAEPTPGTAA